MGCSCASPAPCAFVKPERLPVERREARDLGAVAARRRDPARGRRGLAIDVEVEPHDAAVPVQVAEQLLLEVAVVGVGLDALQVLGDVVRDLLGGRLPVLDDAVRVRNMRPHDATPTVTATLTAMSQIFVRMVTGAASMPPRAQSASEPAASAGRPDSRPQKKPPGGRSQPGVFVGRSRPSGRYPARRNYFFSSAFFSSPPSDFLDFLAFFSFLAAAGGLAGGGRLGGLRNGASGERERRGRGRSSERASWVTPDLRVRTTGASLPRPRPSVQRSCHGGALAAVRDPRSLAGLRGDASWSAGAQWGDLAELGAARVANRPTVGQAAAGRTALLPGRGQDRDVAGAGFLRRRHDVDRGAQQDVLVAPDEQRLRADVRERLADVALEVARRRPCASRGRARPPS